MRFIDMGMNVRKIALFGSITKYHDRKSLTSKRNGRAFARPFLLFSGYIVFG